MIPFDQDKYKQLQSAAIISRLRQFSKGKLYLEIGGKFLYDEHAERVLPGFDPQTKVKIIEKLGKKFDIIVCLNSKDIEDGRVWKNGIDYEHSALNLLTNIKLFDLPKPKIAVNRYQDATKTNRLIDRLKYLGYEIYKRHEIPNYTSDIDTVVSPDGFGKDDYIPCSNKLVLVVGLGSSSGKLSTSLGQIYHDGLNGVESGYAKYELFPVWNLSLFHPLNLAYEAATADIGDENVYDELYEESHGTKAVNYKRDIASFPILQALVDRIVSPHNQMRAYKTPTDISINTVSAAIGDMDLVIVASTIEIKNRIKAYKKMKTPESMEWAKHCEDLLEKAESFTV